MSLATGAGNTYIAVQLLRKIAAAGQLRRALFVCDRDELRSQALTAFQNEFGADAAYIALSSMVALTQFSSPATLTKGISPLAPIPLTPITVMV